ncbi:MAG: diflavin flavoprotein [Gloeocapsa sp. UFS-A4-WI-NPMV-4B04]|jgi:flavorubredoxin/flavin reductase (DIM6/NTAB) family NADH-FMN oxidoreductase RutF|nr:diflavin flavoprotein [Gloeocapsa sp. UFS-A4-WI-NPMV-4B04]
MPEVKKRDVQVLPLGLDTIVMRSRTWDRLKFEVEYSLQRGTTANSYLIQADKTALIDPPGESFTETFLAALQQRVDLTDLDYVILGHANSNRGETLKALLDLAPQLSFVCSNPAAIALRAIFPERGLNITVMRGEEALDLGKGHHLQFIPTPSPRWSDSLCTYDPQTQILYTDKLFGAHICGDQLFDEGWTVLEEDRRYYFDCLFASQTRHVETALDRLAPMLVKLYAPGHGPLVRYTLTELTHAYRRWANDQNQAEITVALIYASAYGNTATLAQAIARGITKAGVGVESINCEFTDPSEIQAAVEKSAGFIIGSPTLGGHAPTQIQTALGTVLSNAAKTKLAGVFGSYGWSGEAIDLIEGKLKEAGYRFGFEPIRVKFTPTDVTLQYCKEAGTDFAQALKRAKKPRVLRQTNVSHSARIEQAVGRILGSLSVVTAKRGDITSAMLASWVSQATFTPPGFTVAVAKDRAIESLMHIGDKFVLNILAEGKQLRRHFLKPFEPGENRFPDVATIEAQNGCLILTGALAYLECTVDSRMECGDHWVIYAVVDNGKVLQPEGVTAIHHRKSGSYY